MLIIKQATNHQKAKRFFKHFLSISSKLVKTIFFNFKMYSP